MVDGFESIKWDEIKLQRLRVSLALFTCDDALTEETLDADDWFLALSKLEQAASELGVMVAMVKRVRERRMDRNHQWSIDMTL